MRIPNTSANLVLVAVVAGAVDVPVSALDCGKDSQHHFAGSSLPKRRRPGGEGRKERRKERTSIVVGKKKVAKETMHGRSFRNTNIDVQMSNPHMALARTPC